MLGVVAGFRLAFLFYIQLGILYIGEAASPSYNFYMALALVILPFYWVLFKLHGLYRFRLNLSLLEVLPAIVTAVTEASMVLLGITIFIFPVVHYSRNIIVISWITTIVCVSIARFIVYLLQRTAAAMAGTSRTRWCWERARSAYPAPRRSCAIRIWVCGSSVSSTRSLPRAPSTNYQVFDDYGKLEEVVQQYHIQHMVVGFSRDHHDTIVGLMERCRPYNVEFTMVPRLYEIFSDSVGVEHIRGLPVLGLKRSSITGLQGFVKRTMDIVISLLALIVLSPVMLLTAIAIRTRFTGTGALPAGEAGQERKTFRDPQVPLDAQGRENGTRPAGRRPGMCAGPGWARSSGLWGSMSCRS